MASWPIFRVRLNFLSYSLRRLRPRRHVLLSRKLWAPSRWSCKAYKLYGSAGLCLPGKSIFARPKMIAPSWPKVVRPVADGKDVARCGLSIGLFLAPLFHDWRHSLSGPPLVANAAAQTKCTMYHACMYMYHSLVTWSNFSACGHARARARSILY